MRMLAAVLFSAVFALSASQGRHADRQSEPLFAQDLTPLQQGGSLRPVASAGEEESSNNNWLCRKCRTVVESRNRPSPSNCPSGGHHQWNNLGPAGRTTYQCKKCAVVVRSKDKPYGSYCPAGGLHQWNRLDK